MTDEISPGEQPAQEDANPVSEPEAPEVAETPEPEQEASEESSTSDSDGDDSTAEPKKSNKVQKRIDELTAKQRQAERDAAYWKEQATAKQNQDAVVAEPEKPSLEQFEHDTEAYEKAMSEYSDKKAEYKRYQERQAQAASEKQYQEHQQKAAFQDRAAEFAAKNPDYFAVVGNPSLPVSQEMATAIQASDKGPDIAYHLGKNPDLAAQISTLPAHQQYMELGRIQSELSAKPVVTPSKSPAPITPVGSKSVVEKTPQNMSMAEYEKWRNSKS